MNDFEKELGDIVLDLKNKEKSDAFVQSYFTSVDGEKLDKISLDSIFDHLWKIVILNNYVKYDMPNAQFPDEEAWKFIRNEFQMFRSRIEGELPFNKLKNSIDFIFKD